MKTILRNPGDIERAIEYLRNLDMSKPFELSITRHQKKRTLPQNKLLWLWLRCVRDETGNEEDFMYQYFCERYLPWNVRLIYGEEIKKQGGSSELNSKEFSEFLDNIHRQMSEEGIYLPQPGELGWDEFYLKYGR